jgi:HK97 family phage portal protein
LAGQEAAARAASGTFMKAVAKVSAFDADEETYQRSKVRLREALRNENSLGGVTLIGPDDDIKSLDLSAADQQLLENRKFDREQIAAIYRVPPSKLQMLEYGVKANGQQQAIDYKADCLSHWGGFIETQLGLGLLTEAERRAGLFLRHNFDALLRATTKERYEALNKAVGGPWMAMNEARREEGLDDVAGGNRVYPPSNMTRDDNAPDPKETEE